MARFAHRVSGQAEGPLYIDTSCIDCGTCRHINSDIYSQGNTTSIVRNQPSEPAQWEDALVALFACPTNSIGTKYKPDFFGDIRSSFPRAVDGPVFYNGFHSEKSYGAASWLIQHPAGNIMVDCPRYNPVLAKRLHELGGVRYIYLTHRDDVADHQKFSKEFKAERILHQDDYSPRLGAFEQLWSGDSLALIDDVRLYHVPGHTRGSTVLHYADKYLFTGDHLAWSEARQTLTAFRGACWYSWTEQIKSMESLKELSFEWVLPGHGAKINLSQIEMKSQLGNLVQWMDSVR